MRSAWGACENMESVFTLWAEKEERCMKELEKIRNIHCIGYPGFYFPVGCAEARKKV